MCGSVKIEARHSSQRMVDAGTNTTPVGLGGDITIALRMYRIVAA